MGRWTINDIPDQRGRVALVTGANSGLGLETVRVLAAKGAHVIMACRSLDKTQQARSRVLATFPQASIAVMQLDLASLVSVRSFAAEFGEKHKTLDLLFNNAGVMAVPRRETEDGFELQFATNYLGHFAVTGLLLPHLLNTPGSRVVTLTSAMRLYAWGRINFDDLNGTASYDRWKAYAQSKQADLLFAGELQRRLADAGASTISLSAHPGYAQTELQATSTAATGSLVERFGYASIGRLAVQSAQMGTLPQLYAALSPELRGGERIGPGGFLGLRGYPHVEPANAREEDPQTATRLWDVSVALTGVDYASLQDAEAEKDA